MSVLQVNGCLSCQHGISWERLLPHLAQTVVEAVVVAGSLCLWVRARADHGRCPGCGQRSGRVHSRYERRLADAPAGGRPVVIRLRVRRFFCVNAACPAVTFAEQVDGLTTRRARRTPLLRGALTGIGVALAGRAGARLAAVLALPATRTALLRLVMALPDPEPGVVTVLGVDDFAFRRGRNYGTVLVNAQTGRPVDLLPDRDGATFAAWLGGHRGTEVICRDRGGGYADGARTGAPEAIQVADRWHIYHNLCGHVDKAVARHRDCLAEPGPDPEPGDPGPDPEPGDPGPAQAAAAALREQGSALARRTRARYEQVQALRAQGLGINAIARQTGLTRPTVRRYYRAAGAAELLTAAAGRRPSVLDEHKPWLHQRWNQGCTNMRQLHAELRDRGWQGSYDTVRAYLAPLRAAGAAPAAAPVPPSTRDIASWILRDPQTLTSDQKATLSQIRQRCPHLDALAGHVTEFAKILTGRHGGRLDAWIAAVHADDQPDLHSFIRGIKNDYDAVANGLTLPYSSGVVEGTVNKIKTFKRQMYGRASFDLLRKRILLAT